MEHASLDEIRTAIEAGLEAKGAEYGVKVNVDYQNAQGDTSTINTICQQFVGNKVDAIVAIATPAAQGAATAVAGTDIPVIFSAVTDPPCRRRSCGKTWRRPRETSRVPPTRSPLKKSSSLPPSYARRRELRPHLQHRRGEQRFRNRRDKGSSGRPGHQLHRGQRCQHRRRADGGTDAAFQMRRNLCAIDNTVASAMGVLADEAIKAGKPVYVAADSMVNDGGLATVGVNYTNLGTQTADMLLKVPTGTPVCEVPVEVLKENAVVVNEETAAAIGVDVSKYAR